MTEHPTLSPRLKDALPFWISLTLIPVVMFAARAGGAWVWIVPVYAWFMTTLIDFVMGLNTVNPDPQSPPQNLFWYRLITLIWFPIQAAVIYGTIYYATHVADYGLVELLGLFFGVGVISGTIGIVYAHELLHQKNRVERWLGDLLLASVLYSHFRSEHLLVHHRYVGTPRDAVTARYNEGFHRFLPRVLIECIGSAWAAERDMLARKGHGAFHRSNPFWRYGALQLGMLVLAYLVGGWFGVALFALQAFNAIWQLEVTNYIEHYGLTRKYLGNGKYEHVLPRHSWNASHKASNWLLINLQRHSDHHYKPDRRFPLLQTYSSDEAPQLPFGYTTMGILALCPPLWRRKMNPRVRAWRRQFYPEITNWTPYNKGTHD
ncbi:MAG: alkane 1-monooxygenase [Rhodovulum sp.]|nr:alkane 1-monooxygenase [Rhodovulum sp.]|tara:strand:+ start:256 stop:1383 length:1128 start_codon:yes stop_codon:yes gene_type:complete